MPSRPSLTYTPFPPMTKLPTRGHKSPGIVVSLPDGSPHTLYKPHPKQLAFHESNVPKLLAIGSRGSGKSLMLRQDAHMRALSIPNSNLVLIRKTFTDLLNSHIIDLPREMNLLGGRYHETNHIAYYPNGSKLFLSYVGNDALNLLSAEYIAAYFDELSVIPWEFYTRLCASVRVKKDSGLTAVVRAATNPLGESVEEIYHYFINKDVDPEDDPDYLPEDWGSIQINMEDNPSLDVEQYRKQFSGFSAHIRKAWLEGVYSPENGIFDFFPTKEGKPYHVIPDIDLPSILKVATIYRAMDFGWYPDPTVCLWIAHLGNRYIVIKEKHWHKTIAAKIAADIKVIDEELGISRVATTFCDPSAIINTTADINTLKDIYEANGIPMECSINNREEFARVVSSALAAEAHERTPKLQLYVKGKEGCPVLAKTIPQMRYHPKHPQKLDDHKADHWTVALAYFLISSSSSDHSTFSINSKIRPWQRPKHTDRYVLGQDNVRDRI